MPTVKLELPSYEEIEAALASDVPRRWGLSSTRGLTITAEPAPAAVWLLCPVQDKTKELPSPTNVIEISLIKVGGKDYYRVGSQARRLLREVYYFLCGLVHRAEESGEELVDVIDSELAAWSALLRTPIGMDPNQQIGLLGELWALWRILKNTGPDAVISWTGPASEQHDFRLETEDLEAKSTLAHSRDHAINGLGQLLVSGDRPLSIISIQVKPAGAGPGASVGDAVHRLSEALSAHPAALSSFMGKLAAIGYRHTDRHLYSERYCLRSAPTLIAVAEGFPKLTAESLADMLPADAARRIRKVVYTVNLDGMGEQLDGTCRLSALRPGEWGDLYA